MLQLPSLTLIHVAVSRRGGIDMTRVRATDPRPCPKCGKIYRSAHTLRTHLEDKHTICPGYRCVLCGTVAKSRNSLHSHMSRQHRGISTKDLPVLPMPSPFDPELASRLLAKAGVRVSAAELAARASPTGPRRSDIRLDLKHASNDRGYDGRHHSGAPSESSVCGEDPEDLSVTNSRFDALSPPNSTALLKKQAALLAAAAVSGNRSHLDAIAQSMHRELTASAAATPNSSTGSALIDTYLQMIAESTGGALGLTPEQQAALLAARNEALRNAAANHPRENDRRDRERHRQQQQHHHHRERHHRREGRRESSGDESDNYSDDDRRKWSHRPQKKNICLPQAYVCEQSRTRLLPPFISNYYCKHLLESNKKVNSIICGYIT